MPTKVLYHSSSSAWQREKNWCKNLSNMLNTGRLFTGYCHWKNRLDCREINYWEIKPKHLASSLGGTYHLTLLPPVLSPWAATIKLRQDSQSLQKRSLGIHARKRRICVQFGFKIWTSQKNTVIRKPWHSHITNWCSWLLISPFSQRARIWGVVIMAGSHG